VNLMGVVHVLSQMLHGVECFLLDVITLMMMIAFITFNSSLVPLIEGLSSSNSWKVEFSGFRRNRTDDLLIKSPSLTN